MKMEISQKFVSEGLVEQFNKSYDATVPYPTIHHSQQNGALWDMGPLDCGIWECGLLRISQYWFW